MIHKNIILIIILKILKKYIIKNMLEYGKKD
jgi:hypothetical protein